VPGAQVLGFGMMAASITALTAGGVSQALGGCYATAWMLGNIVGGFVGAGIGKALTAPPAIRTLHISSGTHRPPLTGSPNSLYNQIDQNGNIIRTARFNSLGNQAWRVDYVGRAHAGISTPHIHIFAYNQFGRPVKNLFRVLPWPWPGM